jgi:hypothetical protein
MKSDAVAINSMNTITDLHSTQQSPLPHYLFAQSLKISLKIAGVKITTEYLVKLGLNDTLAEQ